MEKDKKLIRSIISSFSADLLAECIISIFNIKNDTGIKKPGVIIIPGAIYYDNGNFFELYINGKSYKNFHAVLVGNTVKQLDNILKYLGDVDDIDKSLYLENENSQKYKSAKNKKILKIKIIVQQGDRTQSRGDCITRSKIELRPYQKKVIKFINDRGNDSLLVVHGTGMGKTLSALVASQCFLDANPTFKVTVISPASLIKNFEKEMVMYGGKLSNNYHFYSFEKFTNINKRERMTPLKLFLQLNENKYKTKYPTLKKKKLLEKMTAAYETKVKNNEVLMKKYRERIKEIDEDYEDYDCNNTMLIIDEAHNLRNMGVMYNTIFRCAKKSKKLLLLTATPFVNDLGDFIPLINMIHRDKNILKKNEISNNNLLYGISTLLKNKISFLNDKSSEFYPRVKINKIESVMSDDFYQRYKEAITVDKSYGKNPHVFYTGYRRAVNEIGASEYINQKIDSVIDILDDGKQTIIFTNWIKAGVDVLKNTLNDLSLIPNNNVSYSVISGKISLKDRQKIVKDFNNKLIRILIITMAGSEGLDFKEVSNVIILDPVWNPSTLEQIIGRAVRFKSHINLPMSERLVNVYLLILRTPPVKIAENEKKLIRLMIKDKGLKIGSKEEEKIILEYANEHKLISGDEVLYHVIEEKKVMLKKVIEILKNISI